MTRMNMEILNTIHAVIDYKRFLQSYNVMLLGNKNFDCEKEAFKFYCSLDLPEGMHKNRSDFYRTIDADINKFDCLEPEELNKYKFSQV